MYVFRAVCLSHVAAKLSNEAVAEAIGEGALQII